MGKLKDDKDFTSFSFLSSSLVGGKAKFDKDFMSLDSVTFCWAEGKEKLSSSFGSSFFSDGRGLVGRALKGSILKSDGKDCEEVLGLGASSSSFRSKLWKLY